jgi:Fic family protein
MNLQPQQTQIPLSVLRDRYQALLQQLNQTATQRVNLDLTALYPDTDQTDVLIEHVDDLKRCLDSFRPFDADQIANLEKTLTAAYTYESNRIEGNTLSLAETALILEQGLTIGGKSLREHLEATGHAQAIEYIRRMADNKEPLTDWSLRNIHQLVLGGTDRKNAGVYRSVDVGIAGSTHAPPPHYLVAERMQAFFDFYEGEKSILHPVLLAATLHQRLVNIHPFVDGNGRTARLLMNLVLLKNGFPVANIPGDSDHRRLYYDTLETAHVLENSEPFKRFILQQVKVASIWYLHRVSTQTQSERGDYFLRSIEPLLFPGP